MPLNLTLSAPLADSSTTYFPCHVNNKGQYVLSRAFLQDAFLGANWDPDANKWWLAQAPGRNIQATTSPISIQQTDKTISKGGNNWTASWSGVWDDTPAPSSTPTKEAKIEEDTKEGMSTGLKAGIGAGAAVAALLIGFIAFLFWRRRRQKRANPVQMTENTTPLPTYTATPYRWPLEEQPPQELHGHAVQLKPSPYQRYELSS